MNNWSKKKRTVVGISAFFVFVLLTLLVSPSARFWAKEILVEPVECIAKRGIKFCTTNQHPEAGMTRNILKMRKKMNKEK